MHDGPATSCCETPPTPALAAKTWAHDKGTEDDTPTKDLPALGGSIPNRSYIDISADKPPARPSGPVLSTTYRKDILAGAGGLDSRPHQTTSLQFPDDTAARRALANHTAPVLRDDALRFLPDGRSIYVSSLRRLRHGAWLDDATIDHYLTSIATGHLRSSSHIDSIYVPLMCNPDTASTITQVAARLVQQQALQKDLIFMPVCHRSHWSLVVAHTGSRRIRHLDSLGSYHCRGTHKYSKLLAEVLSTATRLHTGGDPEGPWALDESTGLTVPRQPDGDSCGVYTAAFAMLTAQDLPLQSFTATHIQPMRLHMANRILQVSDSTPGARRPARARTKRKATEGTHDSIHQTTNDPLKRQRPSPTPGGRTKTNAKRTGKTRDSYQGNTRSITTYMEKSPAAPTTPSTGDDLRRLGHAHRHQQASSPTDVTWETHEVATMRPGDTHTHTLRPDRARVRRREVSTDRVPTEPSGPGGPMPHDAAERKRPRRTDLPPTTTVEDSGGNTAAGSCPRNTTGHPDTDV